MTSAKLDLAPNAINQAYYANGNIHTKSDVGTYNYNGNKPHAISSLTSIKNQALKRKHDISYTVFGKIKKLEQIQTIEGQEKKHTMNFLYGLDFERRKTELFEDDNKILTKYFIGSFEQENKVEKGVEKTRQLHYITAGDGLAAIYVIDEDNDANMYYIHKDHLGSIQSVTIDNTSNNSGLVAEFSFDAWGRRRNSQNWSYNGIDDFKLFSRGFTGHEHLDIFNLINMNGRVYDPILGRFLSADPYVQAPDMTQNFNRYSYCLNNPLKYTDPSGEFIGFVLGGILVGGYIGGAIYEENLNPFEWSYGNPDLWKAIAVGGILGGSAGAYTAAGFNASNISFFHKGTRSYAAREAWGIVSTSFKRATMDILMNAGSLDGMFKGGVTGLGAGLWTSTGGFGTINMYGSKNKAL